MYILVEVHHIKYISEQVMSKIIKMNKKKQICLLWFIIEEKMLAHVHWKAALPYIFFNFASGELK